MSLHHYYSLLPFHYYLLLPHYYVIITLLHIITSSLLRHNIFTSLFRHYYIIITSLLPHYYTFIITSLLRHYYVIITSWLRHYYKWRNCVIMISFWLIITLAVSIKIPLLPIITIITVILPIITYLRQSNLQMLPSSLAEHRGPFQVPTGPQIAVSWFADEIRPQARGSGGSHTHRSGTRLTHSNTKQFLTDDSSVKCWGTVTTVTSSTHMQFSASRHQWTRMAAVWVRPAASGKPNSGSTRTLTFVKEVPASKLTPQKGKVVISRNKINCDIVLHKLMFLSG